MKTYSLYLNGQFTEGDGHVEITNPSTEEVFGRAGTVSRGRVGEAVKDAHAAFLGWRKLTGKVRGEWLLKIAAELERRRTEVEQAITMENGKPLAQSIAEVTMSIDHLRWFAEEARRTYGRIIPNWVESKRNIVIKSPVGVVGAISPWNFPLVLAVRKVAPALAAGCSVILKPARQTPISCALFAECVHAAELPAGVFQLVLGEASEIAAEFMENRFCRKVSFTGSTSVGQKLIHGAAGQVKNLSLELGGQGPCLVFDDANLEQALEGVLMAKFRNTGQSCIAANRLYIQSGIYERFVEAFLGRVQAMKIGDGFEPEVQIGPLIDEEGIAKVTEHITDAVSRGAQVLCGGKRIQRKGFFFEPTILTDVPDDALCSCEETFGPVAPIYKFETEEEGFRRANSTQYGLSAYAFTSDLSRAVRIMEEIDAGMIGLNDGVPTATQAPFGGTKMSGWGRELGYEGMEAYLETRHISLGV